MKKNFKNDRLFKNDSFLEQSLKKRLMIVFIKMIVFKNDRYSFSKSSKQVGRFKKRSCFPENETIIFENDRKTKKTIVFKND